MNDQTSTIPNGWKTTTLGEVTKIISGSTPSTKESLYWDGDIPWITPKDLSGYSSTYISNGERNITVEGLKNSSAQRLPTNTILFSSRAPIGYVAIAQNEVTTNQGFKNIVCDEKNSHYRYFFYLLKNLSSYIERLSSGSTFSEASGALMKTLPISIPQFFEQRAIAAVLSSLDDKIELLRKQNKTLEITAQVIFKEWFINFNFPGSTDKMIDSVLGKIPERWRVGLYSDLVDVVTGKGINKVNLRKDGKYQVLGANGAIGRTNEYLFDEDLILTGRVGTLGTIYFSKGKVWVSDNVLISKPVIKKCYYFAYHILKRIDFDSLNRGSTQPLVTQTDLKNIATIIPSDDALVIWHSLAAGLFRKKFSNDYQIQTLSSLRDVLLPKLMKGELRVYGFN